MLTASWIVLGAIGWLGGIAFVLILMHMAGDQDRAARHEELLMDPFSDVTVTQYGS